MIIIYDQEVYVHSLNSETSTGKHKNNINVYAGILFSSPLPIYKCNSHLSEYIIAQFLSMTHSLSFQ